MHQRSPISTTSIAQANAETASGTYVINLGTNATIALTQALTEISLHSGVTLDIEGNGATINGESNQRGLFVNAGNVTIENLAVINAVALGASGSGGAGAFSFFGGGGGGGGGAGLGGGLFVGSGASVALTNDTFSNDKATGGNGGGGGPLGGNNTSGNGGAGGNGGTPTVRGGSGGPAANSFGHHAPNGSSAGAFGAGGGGGAAGNRFTSTGVRRRQ